MAGEGFIAHMIASLKSNKRNRISTFDKIKNLKKSNKSELHFPNKATPKELEELRKKIKKESDISFYKKAAVIIVLIAVILYAIGFVK